MTPASKGKSDMNVTLTVRKTAAAQTVETTKGPVVVQPGETVTAELTDAQLAAVRAAPGHFDVSDKPGK
jgi:hypothetical protein